MTTSGRISGDFLRLLYILAHRQAANFFTRMGIHDPSSKAYKQRRGTCPGSDNGNPITGLIDASCKFTV